MVLTKARLLKHDFPVHGSNISEAAKPALSSPFLLQIQEGT